MPKKSKNQEDDTPKKRTIYTIELSDEHMQQVKTWCDKHLWISYEVDHALFGYKGNKVNVVGYKSGKLVIQGKKTEDFVTYVLEGEITKDPRMGYEAFHNPEWFEAHAGLDESGKGDLFGPLVSACVIADEAMIHEWFEAGIQDSKKITSDNAILKFEKIIKETRGVVIKTTYAGMVKYNELYNKFGQNMNKLLAWMHAKSLEEALKKKTVPWGMLDQFSKKPLVQEYFKDSDFNLKMQTKAEADPVVAAASIIARATYLRQMKKLSNEFGDQLLKGASAQVKEQARQIVKEHGPEKLPEFAKMHFKTAQEALSS